MKLPLIVYSHGLAGSPLGKGYLDVMVQLAAQGYMVAAIFHADARIGLIHIGTWPTSPSRSPSSRSSWRCRRCGRSA
jgi:predicted dienelactone hydrolase